MEQIVRPFQLFDPTATVRIPIARDQVTPEPAHLCWGAAGTLPMAVQQDDTFNGINFRVEECDDHYAEGSRDTEDIRVQDPNNPNNFIVDRRIRRIKFKKTSKLRTVDTFHIDIEQFGMTDLFAGSAFGDVPKQQTCNAAYYLNRG